MFGAFMVPIDMTMVIGPRPIVLTGLTLSAIGTLTYTQIGAHTISLGRPCPAKMRPRSQKTKGPLTMSTTPEFGTQLIGQTENGLGAILDRQLAGSGLDRRRWITLTAAVMSGGTIDRDALAGRVAGALKISHEEAEAKIDELAAAGLVAAREVDRSSVSVTEAGMRLHSQLRAAITDITERLWGDLPADEIAVAGRVLGTVLERINAELRQN
jgi:hypothetical protein